MNPSKPTHLDTGKAIEIATAKILHFGELYSSFSRPPTKLTGIPKVVTDD